MPTDCFPSAPRGEREGGKGRRISNGGLDFIHSRIPPSLPFHLPPPPAREKFLFPRFSQSLLTSLPPQLPREGPQKKAKASLESEPPPFLIRFLQGSEKGEEKRTFLCIRWMDEFSLSQPPLPPQQGKNKLFSPGKRKGSPENVMRSKAVGMEFLPPRICKRGNKSFFFFRHHGSLICRLSTRAQNKSGLRSIAKGKKGQHQSNIMP